MHALLTYAQTLPGSGTRNQAKGFGRLNPCFFASLVTVFATALAACRSQSDPQSQ